MGNGKSITFAVIVPFRVWEEKLAKSEHQSFLFAVTETIRRCLHVSQRPTTY